MSVQEYIDSGILHDYCMNVLSATERAQVEEMCAAHSEIRKELTLIQQGLEKFAEQSRQWPKEEVKENIWLTLDNINKEKAGDLDDLPIINKYSNYRNWLKIVAPFVPHELQEERVVTTIRDYGGVTQMLIISTTDVEEETHEHERESFIILEGECECHVGDNIIRLGPGGFLDIPMHTRHNVKVISPRVTAVLQHVAI